MDQVYVKACFKIGSEEHMKQLLLEGKVCMNTMPYFRTLEGEQGDPHEGAFFCKQATGAKLSSEGMELGEIRGPIIATRDEIINYNMFCLFGLVNIEQDVSSLKFGNTFVVFREMNEFIRRMQEELAKRGYENHVRAVKYEDKETYEGKMGFFTKFTTHIRQSEVRFVARTYLKERFILELGSLTDIAEIGSASEIHDYISKHRAYIDIDPTEE